MTTGEVIWIRDGITSINRVYFDKDDEKVVVGCMYGGIYFLNIQSGETDAHIWGEKMHLNMYGEDIFFPNDKIAQIGDKQVECPSFSFIGAIGTPEGVLLVPAGEGLMLCDKGGNLIWENKDIDVTRVVYQEEKNTICGFENVNMYGKIVIISMETGQVVSSLDIQDSARAFIDNNKTLVGCTGKLYDISQENITEKEEIFEFFVG